ncbi:MAG TPA: diphthine--ammonia ligase [Candidatus Bathyarchaeia archaeon]|nr:diphthine--ammonia ligase [Candidatus Bathyarchaeia archaeon]
MRVAVLFSGGKDSTYATWVIQHQGWEVASLITVKPESPDSMLFHYPNIAWTHLQAQALGIPQQTIAPGKNGELSSLKQTLDEEKKDLEIDGLVTGALASDYQKTRFDNLCDSVGITSFSPLWHKKPATIVRDLIDSGFEVMMTHVAAAGLDQSWLGRRLKQSDWDELTELSKKHGIHLSGEGGEYETFVLDGPNFKERLEIDEGSLSWNGQTGTYTIKKAALRNKL